MLEHFIHWGSGAQEQQRVLVLCNFWLLLIQESVLSSFNIRDLVAVEAPSGKVRQLQRVPLLHCPLCMCWSELGAAPSGSQKESNSLQNQCRAFLTRVGSNQGRQVPPLVCTAGAWVAGQAQGSVSPGGCPLPAFAEQRLALLQGGAQVPKCCPRQLASSGHFGTCAQNFSLDSECSSEAYSLYTLHEVMKGSGLGRSSGQFWSLHLLTFLHGPLLVWKAPHSYELSASGHSAARK